MSSTPSTNRGLIPGQINPLTGLPHNPNGSASSTTPSSGGGSMVGGIGSSGGSTVGGIGSGQDTGIGGIVSAGGSDSQQPQQLTQQQRELANNIDMAIGLSLLQALGGGGEVFGQPRNSLYSNPNFFNALGLPRDNFTFMPTGNNSPFDIGMDLRSILGGNAEVYGRPNSQFANDGMNMLMGLGIFGLLMNLSKFAMQAQAQPGNQPPGTSAATASNEGTYTDTYGQTTETPSIAPASGETTTPARVTPAVRSEPVTPIASSDATTTTRVINVPNGVQAPEGAVCEEPSATTNSRSCVVTRPKTPGM